MADSKVELDVEKLEGVAGGVGVDVETDDIGPNDTDGGSDKGDETDDSTVEKDNINNSNSGKQRIGNQGRGNKVKKNKIRFGSSKSK